MPISSFSAGRRLAASQLNTMVDQINSLTAPGWTDYVSAAPSGGSAFTLTASSSNPTKGNSTYQADYRRPAGADRVDVRIKLTIGSTFVVGSGTYRFGLPFTAAAGAAAVTTGSVWINDSTTNLRAGWLTLDGNTTYATAWILSSTTTPHTVAVLTHAVPQTWATNDVIEMQFSYQPA